MRPRPQGCHWLYVLSDQDIVLSAGEVAKFDTHLPHWFGKAEPRPVEFLSILGPQGERFHVTSSSSWTREIPTSPCRGGGAARLAAAAGSCFTDMASQRSRQAGTVHPEGLVHPRIRVFWAAFTSACAVFPHLPQQNTDWLSRFSTATYPHE